MKKTKTNKKPKAAPAAEGRKTRAKAARGRDTGPALGGAAFPAGMTEGAEEQTKDRACNLAEGNLRDAVESLQRAKDCLSGWDWGYVSPEEIDGVLRVLKKIIVHVVRETA